MGTGLWGHRISCVYPADKDVGKEQSPMKIQEVIDEVNEAWGEEHEEKRKKISWDNLVRIPCGEFFLWTLVYLSPLIILLPALFISPEKTGNLPLPLAQFWINIPYYFLDIRAGIIVSLASILLSLYVSVGKFADGVEGISGDARRATYRKFARIVGEIVFVVFVTNFWYGLIAGYLQGTSLVPQIFGPWSVGPGWGKLIVSEHINLARYQEIPLWVLLFFAWFTMVSSRMLTYSEKDILVRSSIYLDRLKNANGSGSMSYSKEYDIAKCEFEEEFFEIQTGKNVLVLPGESHRGRGGTYSGMFYSGARYVGFGVNVSMKSYILHWQFLKISILWAAVSALAIITMGINGSISVVIGSVFYGIYLYMVIQSSVNLDSNIYKLNVMRLNKGYRRVLEYVSFYWKNWINRVAAYISSGIISIFLLIGHQSEMAGVVEILDLSGDEASVLFLIVFLVISVGLTVVIVYIVEKFVYLSMKRIIGEYSTVALEKNIKYSELLEEDKGKIDFLMVAYIYCLMLEVNKYYMDYKAEVGHVDLSPNQSELIRIRYSRPAIYKELKSPSHK